MTKTKVTKREFDEEGRMVSETITETEHSYYDGVYPSMMCTCGSTAGCPIHRYIPATIWCSTSTDTSYSLTAASVGSSVKAHLS